MPLDALSLCAVKDELNKHIIGSKIDKVQQPERDVIIFSLRGHGIKDLKLLFSVGSGDSRVHLTSHKFDNPATPPMFCMLLRKHLTGAKITQCFQLPAERVLIFKLETLNAMGVKSEKSLIAELIGNRSNLILCDNEGLIIDCLRRIGGDLSEKRSVLPGLIYRNPPQQEDKYDPLIISEQELFTLFASAPDITLEKWLNSTFSAFSPLICREIVWRAYGETDYRVKSVKDAGSALIHEFISLIDQIKSGQYEPWVIYSDANVPKDFSFTNIRQYEGLYISAKKAGFSEMLDNYFTNSAQIKRLTQRSSSTLKLMTTARDRIVRKLSNQKTELAETSNRDYFKECGDIITANFHLMKKGQHSLTAEDFYSESNELREIKLDPLKSPQQNAAKYYKVFSKAKNAQNFLEEQIKNGEADLSYTESVIEQLHRIENENDLNEIRNELIQTGYIKIQNKNKQKEKQNEASPRYFRSSSGVQISVGRNNIQNDRLTLKSALKSDIWLHAQKIHGAHVIISCSPSPPDEQTLNEAAIIAAYYSAARSDTRVPIDYTLVKNVKKPPGSKPGMVIYNDFKTIYAKPDEELLKKLKI